MHVQVWEALLKEQCGHDPVKRMLMNEQRQAVRGAFAVHLGQHVGAVEPWPAGRTRARASKVCLHLPTVARAHGTWPSDLVSLACAAHSG